MTSVFILHHSYGVADDEEVKLIGVYATREDAEAAVRRLAQQPGFRDYQSGFHVNQYEIGKDHWSEGFVSLVTVMMPLLDEGVDAWRPVHAEVLPNARYRILTENTEPEDEHWAFATGQVVGCIEREVDGEMALVAISVSTDSI